jgi:hypothetical protein
VERGWLRVQAKEAPAKRRDAEGPRQGVVRPREQQLQLTACSWNSTHSLERGLYLTPT